MSPRVGAFDTDLVESADAKCGFRCGKEPLDTYLAKYARQHLKKCVGNTWVYRNATEGGSEALRVLGYYTLSMGTVDSDTIRELLGKSFPKFPLPAALIGRLARDERAAKQGIGTVLMVDAFGRVLEVAKHVGCLGVVVDAKDAEAEAFYESWGFQMLEPSRRRMFIHIDTVKDSLQPK